MLGLVPSWRRSTSSCIRIMFEIRWSLRASRPFLLKRPTTNCWFHSCQSFQTLDDILADVEGLDGHALRVAWNWSAAQVVEHVALFITGSLDGFDFSVPLPMRIVGRLLRTQALTKPMRPGFTIPSAATSFVPDPEVMWEDALAHLRRDVERVRGGARMERVRAGQRGRGLQHGRWPGWS